MNLFVAERKRQGKKRPPACIEHEHKHDGCLKAHIQVFIAKHKSKRNDEWYAASNVTPGIALGRYFIEAIRRCDVNQHGIVDDKRDGIQNLTGDK